MSEEGDAPAGRRAVTLDERVYAGVEARARATGRTVEEVLDTLLRCGGAGACGVWQAARPAPGPCAQNPPLDGVSSSPRRPLRRSVLPGARTSPFAASAATAAAADAPAAEARAALLRVSGSGRAASGGGGQRQLDHQGSLLALYITDPIITLVAGLLKVSAAAQLTQPSCWPVQLCSCRSTPRAASVPAHQAARAPPRLHKQRAARVASSFEMLTCAAGALLI